MSNPKQKKSKGLGPGIIAFGVVFALYSVLFRPHSIGAYILAFILSGLAGSIIRIMAQGLDLTVKEKQPDSLQNMAADTGNPDVDALLQRGREMILEIRAENKLIPDESLSGKLNQLEKQCAEIFRAVYDKPAKASQIRKFMEYYLPTTLKMVKGYRVLGERNLSGKEVMAARKRIDEALGVVLNGCQKMLDNLYRDDVLDITTDIDVLEQMLKRDGLTENDLQKAAAQARQAAQVDRQVDQAAAKRAQAAPQPADPTQWQVGRQTDVRSQVQNVEQQAAAHTPQAPVIKPSFYSPEGQAAAQAKKPNDR